MCVFSVFEQREYLILFSFSRVDPRRLASVQRKIEAILASDHELKEEAQRAFKSYLKSVFLMKNKAIFDVTKLDMNSFAASLGLAVPPRVRFIQKHLKAKSEAKDDKKEETPASPERNKVLESQEEAYLNRNSQVDKKKTTALTLSDSEGRIGILDGVCVWIICI